MWTTLLVVGLCYCTVPAQGSPTEEPLPRVTWSPGTRVRKGDTVMLECQVGGHGDEPAIWLKLDPHQPNGDEIISHGELVIMENPRLSVAHKPATNSFVLAIRGVSESDAGRYQCRVPVSSQGAELRAAPPITISLKDSESKPSSSASLPLSLFSTVVCSGIALLFQLKVFIDR